MKNRVVVGVGSNINPFHYIEKAVGRLGSDHRVLRRSALVKTAPVGFTDQPDFVNGAVLLETSYDAARFSAYLKELERELDRVKTDNKYGPRTIDLDIVVWNGEITDDDYHTRDFLKNTVDEVLGEDGQ